MNDERSAEGRIWGSGEQLGFGMALLAVFVAGVVGGFASTLIDRALLSRETSLLVTQFVGVLVGSVALIVFLSFCDWSLSPTCAVVVMVLASAVPLVLDRALTRAETHAVGGAPSALPAVGIGVSGLGAVVGLGVIFVEAWLVQLFAKPAPSETGPV